MKRQIGAYEVSVSKVALCKYDGDKRHIISYEFDELQELIDHLEQENYSDNVEYLAFQYELIGRGDKYNALEMISKFGRF